MPFRGRGTPVSEHVCLICGFTKEPLGNKAFCILRKLSK